MLAHVLPNQDEHQVAAHAGKRERPAGGLGLRGAPRWPACAALSLGGQAGHRPTEGMPTSR